MQHAASEGAAPLYWPFGLGVDMVPQSQWLFDVASAMHFVTGRLLLLSIALHVLGALKHALVDRDGLLTRMISGREVSAPLGAKPKSKGAIWVTASATFAALLLGWVFVQTSSSAPLVKFETAKPEQATWQVLDGTISISVLQLGAEVTGHFENWTADIVFAESASPGQVGQVTTRIDMSSIHLGSVSTQVKGPDFFDSAQFPTAEFRAVINATDENYVAKGHLALKGTEIPVRFPFAMTITDGIAKMSGRTTLDRRDFQIGMNMTDPTQLGFDVQVNLALTAQRQE